MYPVLNTYFDYSGGFQRSTFSNFFPHLYMYLHKFCKTSHLIFFLQMPMNSVNNSDFSVCHMYCFSMWEKS